jgi:hypothetical protein
VNHVTYFTQRETPVSNLKSQHAETNILRLSNTSNTNLSSMSNHYSSQGAGRQTINNASDQITPRRQRSTRETTAAHDTTADLMAMVDEHLASWITQTDCPIDRPPSSGTMIVDWDGSGEPVISYRKKEAAEPLVPAPGPAPRPLAPSREPSQARASTSSRVPAKGRQDPSVYKRKPLPAVPSVQDSMRELHQGPQRKPSTSHQHPERYDSVLSQARTPLSLPPQQRTQAPPAPRPTVPSLLPPAAPQNPNKYVTADGFSATYRLPRFSTSLNAQRPAYVRGRDASTEYEYDYDGYIVHVHRSSPSKRSDHSDYYAVDVESYHPQATLDVSDERKKDEQVARKHGSVLRFVEKVLCKLDGLGLMGKLREERRKNSKAESWRGAGYYT